MRSNLLNKTNEKESLAVLAILTLVALFTVGDMISDIGEGAKVTHLFGEGVIALLSVLGAALLWRRTRALKKEVALQTEKADLAIADRASALLEAKKWRAEASVAMRGLSDAIDLQLSRWMLSISEKEVALLLLKGLSLKEVAEVRGVTEKTARSQSFAIYSKSGLSGRAELSAFFLEDLMLPSQPVSGKSEV